MTPGQTPKTQPRCPICGKPAPGLEHRPFCSPRCADVDLNRWLSGVYAIPASPDADDERLDLPVADDSP